MRSLFNVYTPENNVFLFSKWEFTNQENDSHNQVLTAQPLNLKSVKTQHLLADNHYSLLTSLQIMYTQ